MKYSPEKNRNAWGLLLALTGLTILATYSSVLFPFRPRLLMGCADLWSYFLPLSFFMDDTLHRGALPQWNPLILCGTPFAANPQAALFHPLHLLRGLLNIHPTPWSTIVSVQVEQAANLAIASAGLFALSRAHGLRTTGALVAALGYTASSAAVNCAIQHWHFVAVLATVPWSLFFLRCALVAVDFRGKAQWTLVLAATYGVNLLAGFPQMALYAGLLIGTYAVIFRALHGMPENWTGSRAGLFISDVAVLGATLMFGGALAAPALLPGAEFAEYSTRAKSIGANIELLNSIRLNPFTEPVRALMAFAYYPGERDIRGIGAVGLLLAAFAFRHSRRKDVVIFLGCFVVLMDCAYQPCLIFGKLMAVIAPFKLAGPQRAAVPAAMLLAILAGYGADALADPRRANARPLWWALLYLSAGAGLFLCLLEWLVLDPAYPLPRWCVVLVLIVFVSAAIIAAAAALPMWRTFAPAILLGLMLCETTIWNRAWLPYRIGEDSHIWDIDDLYQPQSIPTANTRGLSGIARGSSEIDLASNKSMFALQPVMTGYDPLRLGAVNRFICAPARETLYNRYVSVSEPTRMHARGYSLLKRRLWLAATSAEAATPPKSEMLRPSAFVPLQGGAASERNARVFEPSRNGWNMAPLAGGLDLQLAGAWRVPAKGVLPVERARDDAPPRHRVLHLGWTAEDKAGEARVDFIDAYGNPVAPGADLQWQGSFGIHETALPLPDDEAIAARIRPVPDGTPFKLFTSAVAHDAFDKPEDMAITEASANALAVNVAKSSQSRTLVFVEASYPGWYAEVDGKRADIERAYGVFQAVKLPPGEHTVRFAFSSRSLHAGLLIGAAMLAIMGVLSWKLRVRPSVDPIV